MEKQKTKEKLIQKGCYFTPGTFKKIKIEAAKEDIFDYQVVQNAVDYYFSQKNDNKRNRKKQRS